MADDRGSLRWLGNDGEHPARRAHQAALRCAIAGDKEGWLALWAEDCEIHDPVGPGLFDPTGEGHHGRSGIEHFWDAAIAPVDRFDVVVRTSHACGDSAAQEATFTTTFADGTRAEIDLIVVYRTDEAGLITSMRAYWELENARLSTVSA